MKFQIQYIDYLLGVLILCDLIFTAKIAIHTYPVFQLYYEGATLYVLVTQNILYFLLGILVVFTYTKHLHFAKWFLLGYVSLVFFTGIINWEPNTAFAKYEIKEMLTHIETQDLNEVSPTNSTTTATAYVHPNWIVKVLYVIGLLYAFLVRPCYNISLKRDAKNRGAP